MRYYDESFQAIYEAEMRRQLKQMHKEFHEKRARGEFNYLKWPGLHPRARIRKLMNDPDGKNDITDLCRVKSFR